MILFFNKICFYKSQNVPNLFFYLKLLETRERVSSDAKAKSKGFLKLLKSKVIVGFMLFFAGCPCTFASSITEPPGQDCINIMSA